MAELSDEDVGLSSVLDAQDARDIADARRRGTLREMTDADVGLAPPIDKGEDWRRAAASGALHGFAQLPGMFGDIQNATGRFVDDKSNLLRSWLIENGMDPSPEQNSYGQPNQMRGVQDFAPSQEDYAGMSGLPTAQQADQVAQQFTPLGEEYAGQTPLGQVANFLGHMAPAAIGAQGPLSAMSRIALAGAGAKGGEMAGEYLGGNENDNQLLAMLGGGLAAGVGEGPITRQLGKLDAWGGRQGANAYARTLGRIQATPAQTNMAGGGYRIGPEPPPPEPAPAPFSRELAKKGRMTPEKHDANIAEYEAQGVDPFEFQLYGKRAGVAKMEGLARDQNLQAGDMAEEAIRPAMNDLQTRSLTSLARMVSGDANITDAPTALKGLAEEIKAAQQEFQPILHDDAITPALEAKIDAILERVDGHVEGGLENATGTLGAIVKEAVETAKASGMAPKNDAQILQFVKRQIWNYAEDLQASPKTALRGAAYKDIFHELQQTLHDGIPGYGEIDAKYSNLITRSQIANKLYERITKKLSGTNTGNIGDNLHEDNAARAAFGADAEPFFRGQELVTKDAQDFSRIKPSVGSPTAGAMSEMAQSLGEALRRGEFGSTAQKFIGQKLADGADFFDASGRNALAEQLLEKAPPERRAQFREFLEELEAEQKRALLAQALAASTASRPPAPPQREAQ